jgi:hypothetical protein
VPALTLHSDKPSLYSVDRRNGGSFAGTFTRTNGRTGGAGGGPADAAIGRGLLSGSFADAMARLDAEPLQRAMPTRGRLTDEPDAERLPRDPALVVSNGSGNSGGNWMPSSLDTPFTPALDQRVLLMAQDLAAFGPASSLNSTSDGWRRDQAMTVALFAA